MTHSVKPFLVLSVPYGSERVPEPGPEGRFQRFPTTWVGTVEPEGTAPRPLDQFRNSEPELQHAGSRCS